MNEFGSFAKLFDEQVLYLTLLHLHTPETSLALKTVKEAVGISPDLKAEISRLFGESIWRPHLVAASALGFTKPTTAVITPAWNAFDQGSWVCPQLAAVLSLYDKSFKQQAIKRLIMACLDTNRVRQEATIQQTGHPSLPHFVFKIPPIHSDPDADSSVSPALSSKGISALTGLLADSSDPEIKILLNRPETLAVVAADSDHGDQIATKWRTTFKRLVQDVG